MLRVATFGEVLWDIYEQGGARMRREIGGAPANVAVGLALLGVPVRVVGAVGADRFGDDLLAALARMGVDVQAVARRPERTGIAFIRRSPDGEPSFLFYRQATADVRFARQDLLPCAAQADFGLMGTSTLMQPGLRNATRLWATQLRRQGGAIVIDLNVRAHLWPDREKMRAHIFEMLQHACIIKGSREDFAALGSTPDALFARFAPSLVIATSREKPVYLRTRHCRVRVAPRVRAVVDATGAGDAFIAGALAYLAHCGAGSGDVAELSAAQLRALAESGNDVAGRVVAACGAALKTAASAGLRRRLDARVAKHAGIT